MSQQEDTRSSSSGGATDRAFGLVMAAAFAVIGLLPLWWQGSWRLWALIVAAAFGATALVAPALLAPLKQLWLALGDLLRRVTTPLVLAFIFYVVLTPMGLLMRLLGKDLLRLRRDASAESYWIERDPPGPAPESFKDQF